MAAQPTSRRRWLWSAGALLLGCLGAEAYVRLQPPSLPAPVVRGGVHRETSDPEQLFENRPGSKLVVEFAQPGGARRVVSHAINEQGFRGPERPLERTPGSLRIACLGDSHTFGHGVAEEETWPVLLEAELARLAPASALEVLNCGVDGYDPYQELVWLRRRVLPHAPDLVLLQLHVNDAAARRQAPRDEEPGLLFRWTHPEQGPAPLRALRQVSRALDALLEQVHSGRQLVVYRQSMTLLYREDEPGWLRAREAVREMRDLLRRRGIRFGVALYPSLFLLDGRLVSDAGFAYWRAFLEAEGIPHLDTSEAFRAQPLAELRVHPHDFHGNARAHAIFAAQVAAWLGRTAELR